MTKADSRKTRVRNKLKQVSNRPRLQVHRSNHYTYAQVIDNTNGVIVASVSEKELDNNSGTKTERASQLGALLAEKALKNGITKVVFDRGPFAYHGRIKALAEAARSSGLEF